MHTDCLAEEEHGDEDHDEENRPSDVPCTLRNAKNDTVNKCRNCVSAVDPPTCHLSSLRLRENSAVIKNSIYLPSFSILAFIVGLCPSIRKNIEAHHTYDTSLIERRDCCFFVHREYT